VKRDSIKVPDLGGAGEVEVIEIAVAVGATVVLDQPLITVESDKASMDLPAPFAGTVEEISVRIGDRVREGDEIMVLVVAGDEAAAEAAPEPEPALVTEAAPQPAVASAPLGAAAPQTVPAMALLVPDLGGADSVEVIEILVQAGAPITEGAGLLVLEGDKAAMEMPAPASGTVVRLSVAVGDRVSSGQNIGELQPLEALAAASESLPAAAPAPVAAAALIPLPSGADANTLDQGDSAAAITRVFEREQSSSKARPVQAESAAGASVYAGPAVRLLAREFGVNLAQVRGSGPKGRIIRDDVQAHVKARLAAPAAAAVGVLPAIPDIDFAEFGPIESVELGNVQKATVTNMSRSWLNVPHVTQFDYADVTELEAFRESLKAEMQSRGNKLTPLPFLLVAVARALREHPRVNSSLAPGGTQLVLKQYCHIGIAVDTPQGLLVPVIRDVNTKSIWELAAEARELAGKARDRKLKLREMQGGCFTISSLGNIGGEGFTPIVNAPEVAILGVSRLDVRPVWNGAEFVPRKTLPLSLSYDHRVINGADAGQFLTYLSALLADIRRLLL